MPKVTARAATISRNDFGSSETAVPYLWQCSSVDGADGSGDRAPVPSSMIDTLPGAVDIMQDAIAQRRLAIEPPEVLLTPRLGSIGPFEYYRAAVAIAEGR